MDHVLRELPCGLPEWRRSGKFFAIALALHLAVIFYPLKLFVGSLEIPPPTALMVRLVDAVSPPKPVPVHSAPEVATQHAPSKAPVREPRKPRRQEMPVAQPAEPVSESASFSQPAPEAAPAPPPPPVVSAARFDAAYLQNPRPGYPPVSRRLGEEGKVLLRVRVTAEGQPATVDLEKSSNFERLDEAARQVVARWRFVPAKRGEQAIEATVIVPIVFRLEG
jgi:periplasmic protein TonB